MYKNNRYLFMKITLAKSAGFCFGVKRALDVVLKTIQSDNKVYLLGNIVHNEIVVRQLRKSGVKIIRCLVQGAGKTLIIRAHGASKATLEEAKKLGYKIIDATCPTPISAIFFSISAINPAPLVGGESRPSVNA